MRVLDWKVLEDRPKKLCHPWRYGLLVEDIAVDGFFCESYGVMVTDCATGQVHRRRHVTVSPGDAAALLDLLARCQVSPATLDDVLEDWLGR